MTNYERIQSMSIDEMAEWLAWFDFDDCCDEEEFNALKCERKQWLEQEAENDTL